MRAPSTSRLTHRPGLIPTSPSQSLLIPSPHRTGLPISWRFSIMRTWAPCLAAHLAVMLPAGPPPMTRTSVVRSGVMGSVLERDRPQPISIAPTGQALTQISHRTDLLIERDPGLVEVDAVQGADPDTR